MQCIHPEKRKMSVCNKKYYSISLVKKKKCINYKELPPKYVNDGKYFVY